MLIVFLCAGTSATGAGHLSRCLALGGAYRKAGWRVEFIVTGDAFAHLFGGDCSWHVAVAEQTMDAFGTVAPDGCDILVIDDYARNEVFESDCRSLAQRIIVLDDQSGRRHRCDVLIDAAVADVSAYHDLVGGTARILAGPKYALIRSDVLRHRRAAMEARAGRGVANILVNFGATDPAGLTLKVFDAVADHLPDEVLLTVALSSSAGDLEAIRSRTSRRIRLLVDADIGKAMAAADLAIGAGGVGAFERAALGLPGIVVTAAANQRGIARLLVEAGAAFDGGEPDGDFAERMVRQITMLTKDADLRASIASAAAALIDGRAADRIHLACTVGVSTSAGAEVLMRAAELEDAEWLLALQREPATRRFARNPSPPSDEEHTRWLAALFEGRASSLMIVEADGAASGMVRLDRLEPLLAVQPHYEISLAISTAFHGRGIGSVALRLIRDLYPGAVIDAHVLPKNESSLRMFLRAGYIDVGNGCYRSVPRNFHASEQQHAV